MGLGCEVNNGVEVFFGEQAIEQGAIADISLYKPKTLVIFPGGEVLPISRIGQGIEHHNAIAGILRTPIVNKITADKPCPTRHE